MSNCFDTPGPPILGTEQLIVVDISGVKDADGSGLELLSAMRDSGARLVAALPLESPELVRSMGIPIAASPAPSTHPLLALFTRLTSDRPLPSS